jgi:hypothetical protein
MPEITHYGGGSAIGLSNVTSTALGTPSVLVSDAIRNLAPLVPPPSGLGPPLAQVNMKNTDVHIPQGTLVSNKVLTQGGFLQICFQ